MEVVGSIKKIFETKTFGANGFRKRELVVSTDEQYPQQILIEFVQDKCDILDNYQTGTQVRVQINIRGREWINPEGEAKYFNSIQGWRIENAAAAAPQANQMPPMETMSPSDVSNDNEPDDLPF